MEDPSESPISVGANGETNPMKLSPLKNMQNLLVRESQASSQDGKKSNEDSNTKSDVRRSPRKACKLTTSPTNSQRQGNNKGSKNVDTDLSNILEKNVSLENDLELSSSEADAESVSSSTRSNQTSPRMSWVNSCVKVLSPRRSRRLSSKSNDSDTGESPSREKNVRLTRSKRLSESSNDSTSGPSGDTEVRNTRSRKLSESKNPEIPIVNEKADKPRSPGVVKRSPSKVNSLCESQSPCDNKQIGENKSNETHTPGRKDTESSNAAQDINKFKEPFPISSPRTRRKTKSESVDNSRSNMRNEFEDKRVTRSTSCPDGVGNVNSKSPKTRTRHVSSKCPFTEDQKSNNHGKATSPDQDSENKQPVNVESGIRSEAGPKKSVDSDGNSEKQVILFKRNSNRDETRQGKCDVVPRTRSDSDESVGSKLKCLPATDLEEDDDQRLEITTRITRSQVKTVKSPEVIKREAGLEQIRLSRARKRSKREESESDNDEEPIQKKLNRSRTLIESDSESDDNKDDTEIVSRITRSRSKALQDHENGGTNELEQKTPAGVKSLNQDEGKYNVLFVGFGILLNW